MDWNETFNCLQLDNDRPLNDEIWAICNREFDALVYNRALGLSLIGETTLTELIRETFLVGRLKKARTKGIMNGESGADIEYVSFCSGGFKSRNSIV